MRASSPLSHRDMLHALRLMLGAAMLVLVAIVLFIFVIDRHWAFGFLLLLAFSVGVLLGLQDLRGGTLTTVQALNLSGALIVLSVFLFATLSYMLEASGVASYHGSGTPGDVDRLFVVAGYYGWHFLDMLPVIEATETLDISAPLTISGVGPLLPVLLFKAFVGLVLLRVIVSWWKGRGAAERAERPS